MKNFIYILLLGLFIYSCGSSRNRNLGDSQINEDTVRIANDSLEYEIIIIEPGFNLFINSIAKPEGYYSQQYLENKNRILVSDYNQRVRQPQVYNSDLYLQEINYDPNIDYGYEVNYLLYNYFVFFSRHYNQRFSVPTRI
ncbi:MULTISPECIES: DUF6146 family protein [Salegentibacter]|jgi:hypothetical protein|uniref:Uncharacterized protein n=1 Tax=Salegentibacter agarivorans TaxID=345907 RepID=A0A1I2N3H3_9FLAO|nr:MULTISPECIES: DUF6146 family protein [Salegentibacter]APS39753.1 hypothetical protein AO058_13075 [Salegentibacter sp. T436]MBO2545251.1 hypothetical protein [Salegentibacter sp. BDJ18]SFF98312.1 hypothetical protein SAMN04488033_11841 [Salegentibacter agarivorans]|tara:strand:+ start:344 stop:763 length:420 start_codon:yes stop_codon:yes gene_type:complete